MDTDIKLGTTPTRSRASYSRRSAGLCPAGYALISRTHQKTPMLVLEACYGEKKKEIL
jgi:hypothetical protein